MRQGETDPIYESEVRELTEQEIENAHLQDNYFNETLGGEDDKPYQMDEEFDKMIN